MTDQSTRLPPLLLVGGGHMGSAMLSSWREYGMAPSVLIDPSPITDVLAGPDLLVIRDAGLIPAGFIPGAIIVAVKPQTASDALVPLRRFAGSSVFISIMAGRTIAWLRATLGDTAAVVRAMPNTPASIRAGISVACIGPHVSLSEKKLAQLLLSTIGHVEFVVDETQLNPVTAISGGGPAYVFLLVELLERAGIEQGLCSNLARTLARQTIIGAAKLLESTSEDAASLRRAVTSPAGTTEQALAILMADSGWPRTISDAIAAATLRSCELGS